MSKLFRLTVYQSKIATIYKQCILNLPLNNRMVSKPTRGRPTSWSELQQYGNASQKRFYKNKSFNQIIFLDTTWDENNSNDQVGGPHTKQLLKFHETTAFSYHNSEWEVLRMIRNVCDGQHISYATKPTKHIMHPMKTMPERISADKMRTTRGREAGGDET